MGKVLSTLWRPISIYNIESRAAKIISKGKPQPAPSYPATDKMKEAASRSDPNIAEKLHSKNVQLDEHLKQVYLRSEDPKVVETKSDRPLPQYSRIIEPSLYGVFDPKVIPDGKCTIEQVLIILNKHMEDPDKHDYNFIAEKYKLDKEATRDLLKYVGLYNVSEMNVSMDTKAEHTTHLKSHFYLPGTRSELKGN